MSRISSKNCYRSDQECTVVVQNLSYKTCFNKQPKRLCRNLIVPILSTSLHEQMWRPIPIKFLREHQTGEVM